eukprot:c136_g1_i1.p1 GENE.c136_g1_i1~~c136_g1_i1.p1  ORF type:complete len:302 (-),score=48.69 c136_g1_i1:14-919(-)
MSRFVDLSRKVVGLLPEEKLFLKQNGYLLIKNFLTRSQAGLIEKRMSELLHDFDPASVLSVFRAHREKQDYEDQYFLTSGDKVRFFWEADAFDEKGTLKYPKSECVNKVGHALHTHDPVFGDFVFNHLRKTIHDAGFRKPIPLQTMYICKSQRTGGEVTPHQDSTFLYTNPKSCHGFWLSVHAADKENGCLWVVPGSHAAPLYQRFVRTPSLEQPGTTVLKMIPHDMPEGSTLPTEGGVPVETEVGDLVVLHGQLIHWSLANTSNKSRHSFMTHVIDGADEYPADNWLQYPKDTKLPTFPQ